MKKQLSSIYEDLKIPDLLFTSHNTPHITLDNEKFLNSYWEFATLINSVADPNPDPDPHVLGLLDPDPDPSIIKKK